MLAFINAEIWTVSHGKIKNGKILLQDGKITALGKKISIPVEATVIDVQGKIITPGLIDSHSHVGVMEESIGWAGDDVNECTDPNTAQVRALDGINPYDQGFEDCLVGGVTTVQVGPGSGNVIGGEMVVLKTAGSVVDQMVIKQLSGMKAALGENPKNVYGSQKKMPSTRMGSAAVLRTALMDAKNYMLKKEAGKEQAFDMRKENLIKVLKREIPLRVHAHRADDIVTALRIGDEFKIEISLEHCTEGDKVADLIAAKGVYAAVGPTMSAKSKVELKDMGYHTPVALAKAGVAFSIISDHPLIPEKYLHISAGLAIREGLDEEIALKAITEIPAKMLGLYERIGSLEVGKDADLVVWSEDPFEMMAQVCYTVINGTIVWQGGK